MKTIEFEICISSVSEEMFSDKIMIPKPGYTHKIMYTLEECLSKKMIYISDIIAAVSHANDAADLPFFHYSMDECTYETVYVKYKDCLLGLTEDKTLTELFEVINSDTLSIVYIYVAGGASIGYWGYRFIVHSDEYVHKDSPHPHVHVVKDGVSVRYYLDSFERFPQDKPTRAHCKDERKIIKPFLKSNQKKLLEYWELAMRGYMPPTVNEAGEQFYRETSL